MNGLPKNGDKVKIWPFPGRRVQQGPRPVDFLGGGRFLLEEGEIVAWQPFHLEQLRAGDILLVPPKGKEATLEKAEDLFDPLASAAALSDEREKEKEAEKASQSRPESRRGKGPIAT